MINKMHDSSPLMCADLFLVFKILFLFSVYTLFSRCINLLHCRGIWEPNWSAHWLGACWQELLLLLVFIRCRFVLDLPRLLSWDRRRLICVCSCCAMCSLRIHGGLLDWKVKYIWKLNLTFRVHREIGHSPHFDRSSFKFQLFFAYLI
jgi:hypothetical protein